MKIRAKLIFGHRTYVRGLHNKLDCVEVFSKYIGEIHRAVYDKIYIENASNFFQKKKTFSYDLVLLIDVLEHFTKEEGKKLIRNILEKNKFLLISIPKNVVEQGAEYDNPHERHVSRWKKQELKFKDHFSFFIKDKRAYLVVIGKKELKKKILEKRLKRNLRDFVLGLPGVERTYQKIRGIAIS
jgi:hypothetical protein